MRSQGKYCPVASWDNGFPVVGVACYFALARQLSEIDELSKDCRRADVGLSSYSYLRWLTCGQDSGASPSIFVGVWGMEHTDRKLRSEVLAFSVTLFYCFIYSWFMDPLKWWDSSLMVWWHRLSYLIRRIWLASLPAGITVPLEERKQQVFVTNLNWLCGRHFISVWYVAHEVQSFQAGLVLYVLLNILMSRTLDDYKKYFHR